MPAFWWLEIDLVPLMGRVMSGGVSWVSQLCMTLDSLSANAWDFVSVSLVDWCEASSSGACCQFREAVSWY